MNIAVVHGQNHQGTSCNAGRLLLAELGQGNAVAEFFLPRDMPHFCTGCYACMDRGEAHCPHHAAMGPITKALDEADLLVFTTPVYCMRASAPMKALLDHLFVQWVSHRPKAAYYHKRAVVIAAGAGAGMARAAADIKVSLAYWGISQIHAVKVRSMTTTWNKISDGTKTKIQENIQKTAKCIEKNTTKNRVKIRNKLMFNMMRGMQRGGKGACERDRAHWQQNGWLKKARPWKGIPSQVKNHPE